MTISIWRYSHLALAVSSFIFIAIASFTGIILSFKPVAEKIQPFKIKEFNQLSVAELLPNLNKKFTDVIEVSVDNNQFVVVDATDLNDNSGKFYINPNSGAVLGKVEKENEFFQWVTALHRSLFLHQLGRFFVGLATFLLLLIATSGTVLIIQRQRGIKAFFSKIVKDNFAQYYHVVLGRLLLIPIIIISVTGVVISMQTFEVFKDQKITAKIDFDTLRIAPQKEIKDFDVFKQTRLSEVKSIEFPFSTDVEDYFILKLKDKEITVNQLTGDVLSMQTVPEINQLVNLSMDLHTGRTNLIWAIVLAIASANILFFIYSGFLIWWKRRQGKVKNVYKAAQAEYIILVGSENGSTFLFAKAIHQQLLKNGRTSFIGQLNDYKVFPNAQQLIFFTATYGLGEAPTNSAKFIKLLNQHQQLQSIDFSVVAFGSHAYPEFCKFGFEVNHALLNQKWAKPLLEIHTVNDRSLEDFAKWSNLWAQNVMIELSPLTELIIPKPLKKQVFNVVAKRVTAQKDPSFILRLSAKNSTKISSGDLLSIFPANDHRERQYSIGKIGKDLQLSVKLHKDGIGSGFLYQLEVGQSLNAAIIRHKHFHFPLKAKTVIMVSNGTGIAPFLGMIDQYGRNKDIHLYCGFRDQHSFSLYENILNVEVDKLKTLHVAFSREGQKQYVKDLLYKDVAFVHQVLLNDGCIMLCGSLSMQKDVVNWLEQICQERSNKSISFYQSRGQVLMDCY